MLLEELKAMLPYISLCLALLSCFFAYRSVKPKIKVIKLKNDKKFTFNAFIEEDFSPKAIVRFLIENRSPNKTQIKQVCVVNWFWFLNHNLKTYKVENKYFGVNNKEIITSRFDISEYADKDLLLQKVPLTLDSFEIQEVCFTFPNFPRVKKDKKLFKVYLFVVGKKLPIKRWVTFKKIPVKYPPESFIMNGKKIFAQFVNKDKNS